VANVWSGLGESAFISDVRESETAPLRLAGALVGGLVVATVAAVACWCLVMVGYTLFSGRGASGLQGLGQAAQVLVDPDRTDLGVTLARLAVTALVDGGFLLVFAAFAAGVAREPLGRLITVAPRPRGKLLILGMLLALIALAPIVATERALGGPTPLPILGVSPHLLGRIAYGATALLLIPAAAAEELVFRGWLLRRAGAFTVQSGALIVFTGVIFAAAHFDFNPDAFLTRALMGMGFAYMTLRLGGIEFSAGVHATHNMLIVIFLEPLNIQAEHPALSAFSLLEDASLLVGYFIITEAVVHVSGLRRWAGVLPREISPPDNRPAQA
jgi:membrane protease YdiL (CAAX protease family)